MTLKREFEDVSQNFSENFRLNNNNFSTIFNFLPRKKRKKNHMEGHSPDLGVRRIYIVNFFPAPNFPNIFFSLNTMSTNIVLFYNHSRNILYQSFSEIKVRIFSSDLQYFSSLKVFNLADILNAVGLVVCFQELKAHHKHFR